MPRKRPPRKRPPRESPSEVVLSELHREDDVWDLDKHLKGCLAAYMTEPSYGTAVFFALESLRGIARDKEIQAEAGDIPANELDPDWTILPTTPVPVPWMWIRALAEAWSKYLDDEMPLGHAFGLEGGRGKSPIDKKLAQILDERAIARWINECVREARSKEENFRIEDAVHEAAEKFGKSDVTIRRAWQRFGPVERRRASGK